MDGDELTKGVVVADAQTRRLAVIFQILRLLADRAVGVKLVAAPDGGWPGNGDVVLKPAAIADAHTRFDDAIRPDANIRADLHGRINDRRRMDLRAQVCTSVNNMSASETTSSLTTQRPVARAILPLNFVIST